MAADDDEAPQSHAGDALRTAASAAIAGAAVGAAQALARRRHADSDDGTDEPDEADLSDAQPEAGHDGGDVDGGADGVAEEDVERGRAPDERGHEEEPVRAATSPSRTREIVERAREQLRDLRGADAETVSSIRRTSDGWRVGLDVVEVHRIPESTDVLATYELDLDEEGNLITFERTARYHRSEADRG